MATDLVRRASVAWLLIFFAVLAGSTAQSQPTPVRPLPQSGRPDSAASQMPLSEADLRTDSRLSQVLNLDVRGVEMEKIMDAVSKQTGNTLSVARKWKDRRYTGMMRRGTVAAFMLAIARTCRMSWRNLPDVESAAPQPAHRYELYQSDEEQQREVAQKAASENREKKFRNELIARLRGQIRNALAGGDPGSGGLEDLVGGYSSGQLDRAMQSALEPPDIISASDQSHFHSHFLFTTSFSRLSPAQQGSVRSILDKDKYHPTFAGDSESGGHPEIPADFSSMKVGLIAAAGGLRLGVMEPDGKDVWVSPGKHIGGVSTLDAQVQENDFDPLVERMLRSASLADLSAMPAALRRKVVRFPEGLSHRSLSEFLGSIAEQTAVANSCDDFLNSRATSYPNSLGDKPEYTVEEALRQLARAFGHRMKYENQMLYASTVTLGLDLRLEPSARVMLRLSELLKPDARPGIDDTILFGECTKPQVNCIIRNHPIKLKYGGLLFRIGRIHACLRLYALLTPDLRAKAEEMEGLGYGRMSNRQKTAFDAVVEAGLPATDEWAKGVIGNRLYVRRLSAGAVNAPPTYKLFVYAAGRGEPPLVRRFEIK